MDYINYSAKDLATDSTFRRWVMQPDQETDQFWIGLLREQPQQVATIVRAIQLVRQLNEVTTPKLSTTDTDQIEAIWQSLRSQIEQEAHKPLAVGRRVRFNPSWGRWAAAACIVLALGAGWWFSRQNSAQLIGDNQPSIATNDESLREAVNNTANPILIKLSDGSLVKLQPKSRLSYAKQFAANKREVYLKGEAFFEVTKNPSRPFLVFAGETVTKVVGTSFQVQAYEQDETVRVVVRTGRVSVFTRRNFDRISNSSANQVAGVVLTPNQRATFEQEGERLVH